MEYEAQHVAATLSTLVLMVGKAVTVVLGSVLALLAARAYRRTGSPALGALSVGIGLITLGALAGGVLHQVLGVSLATGVSVQAVCTAVGFAVMTYAVYGAGGGETVSATDAGTD